MSLVPADLVTDLDVLALDARALTDFGTANATLTEKRRVAVSDWLKPRLEAFGYPAHRHMTRRAPDVAFRQISSVLGDVASIVSDATPDDLDLSAIFVGPAANALYLGAREPFRGLFIGMQETVNAVAAVASITYWNGGAWAAPSSLVDGTLIAAGKSFSGGGRISWALPDTWAPRLFGNTVAYFARVTVSNTLTTGATVGQILPLARSRLTYPAALHTLGRLYLEGWASSRGDWQEKGDRYLLDAEKELSMVLPLVGDEFDIDVSGAVDATEVNSVTAARGDPFTWERG